ncbi:MAG: aldose 1-epimerase [Planctomycetota bacterium]
MKSTGFHNASLQSLIRLSVLLLLGTTCNFSNAGNIRVNTEMGQDVYTLIQGTTVVKVAPASGANVFSIRVNDVEYLHPPETAEKLAGVGCGVPILYPTPNRVRAGKFTFEDQAVQFPMKPKGRWFIHGLVNRHPWEKPVSKIAHDHVAVTFTADFSEGTDLWKQFPFPHRIKLQVEVREARVRWTYTVDNTDGNKSVPFGFALHPYFKYQGEREQTFLTIPATHMMESEDRMPTGALIAADDLDLELGEPMTLAGKSLDDVFWGMKPSEPTRIEFRDVRRQIQISASKEYTHLVVWTPDRSYFGVESQTCSTDAHNLYAAGKVEEAHLQICPPEETMSGWVEYQFTAR